MDSSIEFRLTHFSLIVWETGAGCHIFDSPQQINRTSQESHLDKMKLKRKKKKGASLSFSKLIAIINHQKNENVVL